MCEVFCFRIFVSFYAPFIMHCVQPYQRHLFVFVACYISVQGDKDFMLFFIFSCLRI